MKDFLKVEKIAILIVSVAVIGAFVLAYFRKDLDVEVFKISFQFLLIIVLGGAVTLFYNHYNKQKELTIKKDEARDLKVSECKKLQHQFHNEFIKSYNSIKFFRRIIRARARILKTDLQGATTISLDTKTYDLQLQELTKLQLQFEFYVDEAISNPNLFTDKTSTIKLKGHLVVMADYLNELVTEYEDCYKTFPDKYYLTDALSIPLTELPVMRGFIVKYENANEFKKRFKEPAHKAQEILLTLIDAGC